MSKWNFKKLTLQLLFPIIGAICGIVYSIVDESVYQKLIGSYPPQIVVFSHDVIDWIIPVLLGILIGLGVNILQRLRHLNKNLTMQNVQFQRDLLVSTLTSQFLHEIRNPIHNLSAAIEESQESFSKEQREIIQRNLQRFEIIIAQYKKFDPTFGDINPIETLILKPWIEQFIEDKLSSIFKELNIHYSQAIDPLKIHMHPVLLEQSLLSLFGNACEELVRSDGSKNIAVSASLTSSDGNKIIKFRISNSGRFPEEVLKVQGRFPVKSSHGTGLGLVLLKKIVAQVNGEMMLENTEGKATVTLFIPGDHL